MNQIEFFDIQSPCKRICETDKQGYCLGCYRSRDERFNWLAFTDTQKQEILRLCRQRAIRRRYLLLQQQQIQPSLTTEQLDLDF